MTQIRNRSLSASGISPCGQDIGELLQIRLFKALCDPNRVAILADLAQCAAPCTVREIAADLPIDVSVVSRHLAQLRDAEVLAAEKRGKEVYYSVRYQTLATTLRAMAEAIDACCPSDAAPSKESSDD